MLYPLFIFGEAFEKKKKKSPLSLSQVISRFRNSVKFRPKKLLIIRKETQKNLYV